MSEQNSHNNPWNEKLKHLAVPDVNDTWNAMQTLLDKEMPVRRNNDNLRWLLLLLLLLLVIGVCNCPGLLRENKFSEKNVPVPSVKDSSRKNTVKKTMPAINEKESPVVPGAGASTKIIPGSGNSIKGTYKKDTVHTDYSVSAGSHPSLKNKKQTSYPDKRRGDKTTGNIKGDKNQSPNNLPAKKEQEGKNIINDIDSASSMVTINDTAITKPRYPVRDTSATSKKDSTINTSPKPDTGFVKIPLPDSVAKEKNRGLVLAIGLNQFFAIGGQKPSSYNSSGTTGVLADYIPVPQVRYHFNKKLYVQLEAQFNAPQYTRQILASQYLGDSVPQRPRIQHSVYIKKLFYFNLPLSVHYSPVKKLSLGAGLQFSQLRNAVGLFEDRRQNSSIADTGNTSKFQSLKSDSVYDLLKTNEWRFLADVNYQWNRFTLGLRYNQAFNYFINVRISNTQITQARNNSLQFYLRYDIWDGRKR